MVIVLLVVVAALIFFSISFTSRKVATHTPPLRSTIIYRLLYPNIYLEPNARICQVCGYSNPPTDLECVGTAHPADKSRALSLQGEIITKQSVRIWGIRFLLGLILLSALWLDSKIALYAILAATAFWIISPLLVARRGGLNTFLATGIVIFCITGVLNIITPASLVKWLNRTILLPKIDVGFLHIPLNNGHVTNGILSLIGILALLLFTGIFLSTVSHFSHVDAYFNGPIAVLSSGIFVSAFLLLTLSLYLNLNGAVLLFLDLMVVSFGWLLTAFVERAIERGSQRVVIKRNQPYLPPFNGFSPIKDPLQPKSNDNAIVQMSYGITVALVFIFNGLIKVASGIVSNYTGTRYCREDEE